MNDRIRGHLHQSFYVLCLDSVFDVYEL